MIGKSITKNKIVYILFGLLTSMLYVRNIVSFIVSVLRKAQVIKIYFRDGNAITLSGKDYKTVFSIARLMFYYKVSCTDNAENLIVSVNEISYKLRKNALRSQIGSLNELYIYETYNFYNKLNFNEKVVIDIGGYIGDTALYFSSLGANVISFEPVEKSYKQLLENLAINPGLQKKVTPFNYGLSNITKSINFSFDEKLGSSSLNQSIAEAGKKDNSKDDVVQVYNIDDVVILNQAKNIFLLKIDCEGCEYNIFMDTAILQKLNPKYIICEYHNGHELISKKLADTGYIVEKLLKLNGEIGMIYAKKINE